MDNPTEPYSKIVEAAYNFYKGTCKKAYIALMLHYWQDKPKSVRDECDIVWCAENIAPREHWNISETESQRADKELLT